MVSTVADTGVSEVDVKSKSGKWFVMKPNVQVQYNKGLDCFDNYCLTYPFNWKTPGHLAFYEYYRAGNGKWMLCIQPRKS
jgi:hypothetical protein